MVTGNRVLLSFLLACSHSAPPVTLHASAITTSAIPGVVGDGVADDRVALQTALSATPSGGVLVLQNGTYLVSKGSGAWCLTVPTGVTLRGESRDGVVLIQAPGIGASVRLLEFEGAGASVDSLTLDGNRALQTVDEHRAGIFVIAADISVRNVTARAFTGDGFDFYSGSDRFVVENSLTSGNGRDGIAVIGQSDGGVVRGSTFIGSHAQQFDSEPGASAIISNLTISGSTFDGTGLSTDYAMTVSGGSSMVRSSDWDIHDNVINGGINVVWADRITIRNNTGKNPTGRAHVRVYRTCNDVTIEDNVFDSSSPNTEGTIFLSATGEGGPMHTIIRRNRLVSDSFGVHAEGGCSVHVLDNELIGPGTPSGGAGVYLRAVTPAIPFAYAIIDRNLIRDFGSKGVKVDGYGASRLNLLSITGNTFDSRAGSMAVAMALNDGTGCALDVRESGNILLGACVTKVYGLPPAGALTATTGQRWLVP